MERKRMRLAQIWPGILAHASGGLWLEESSTLAVADLHLGYGWAQRRRGQLGPLVDQETCAKITHLMDELSPRKLLLVGDIVHAAKPGIEEAQFVESTLRELSNRAELVCIRGNHDRHFSADFKDLAIPLLETWDEGCLSLVHGDRLPASLDASVHLAIGHLHPAVGIQDAAGVKQKLPAFLVAGRVVVLPAFSPFATGMDVWKEFPLELASLTENAVPEAIAATGARVVKLGPLNRRAASPAMGTWPRDYRASK
jgi:hypothetical protein